MFESSKLIKFYIEIFNNYAIFRKYGSSLLDSKIQILQVFLALRKGFFHKKTISFLTDIDILDIAIFIVWFNISHNYYMNIPKVKNIELSKSTRDNIYEIAFKSGSWWFIQGDIRNTPLDFHTCFTNIGELINNDFKLI